MGRRHAGGADQRLQGRPVARCQWQPAGQLRQADRADPPAKLRDPRSSDDDRGSDFLHGAVDGNPQTAAGTAQRAAGLLLPREREVPGAHGEDKEVSRSRIPAAPMSARASKSASSVLAHRLGSTKVLTATNHEVAGRMNRRPSRGASRVHASSWLLKIESTRLVQLDVTRARTYLPARENGGLLRVGGVAAHWTRDGKKLFYLPH